MRPVAPDVIQRARLISEAELQAAVIEGAHAFGYLVAHFRPARTEHGYRTPVQADGKGWPDLVLVGRGRVLFRELKAVGGRASKAQLMWGVSLRAAGADYGVWTPVEWLTGQIEEELAA